MLVRYFDDMFDSLNEWPMFSNPSSSKQLIRTSVKHDTTILSMDLPGVKKEDVEITYQDKIVRVSAKRADTKEMVTHRCLLEKAWDFNSATARLADGVLTINIPRNAETTAKKLLIE